ncbi:MAG TPA: hypothetical protein VMZ50_10840, partial [Phycisphaerae bacterium]|nr:hypothetical protein [Phycisphaerae bacterium]
MTDTLDRLAEIANTGNALGGIQQTRAEGEDRLDELARLLNSRNPKDFSDAWEGFQFSSLIPGKGASNAQRTAEEKYDTLARLSMGKATAEDLNALTQDIRPADDFGHMVGQMSRTSVEMAPEFVASSVAGGVVGGAAKAVGAGVKAAKAANIGGRIAGLAATQGGRVNANAIRRAMGMDSALRYADDGTLEIAFSGQVGDIENERTRARVDVLIEDLSELSGGLIDKVTGLAAVKTAAARFLEKKYGAGAVINMLRRAGAGAAMSDPLTEVLEEVAGAGMRAGTRLLPEELRLQQPGDAVELLPGLKEAAAMFAAFAMFPIAGGGVAATVNSFLGSPQMAPAAVAAGAAPAQEEGSPPGGPREAPGSPPGGVEGEASAPTEAADLPEDIPEAPGDLLARVQGVPELSEVSEAGTAQTSDEAALQAREAKGGAGRVGRTVWFADLPPEVGGYMTPEGEVVLRRGTPARTMEAYAAHESVHVAALKNPKATKKLLDAMDRLLPEEMAQARKAWAERYEKSFGKPAPTELSQEEAAAVLAESLPTLLPKLVENPEALNELLAQRGFLQKVLDAMAALARKLSLKIKGREVGLKLDGPTIKRLRAALGPDVPRGTAAEAVKRMAHLATMLARVRQLGEGEVRRTPEGKFTSQEDGRFAPEDDEGGIDRFLGRTRDSLQASLSQATSPEERDRIGRVIEGVDRELRRGSEARPTPRGPDFAQVASDEAQMFPASREFSVYGVRGAAVKRPMNITPAEAKKHVATAHSLVGIVPETYWAVETGEVVQRRVFGHRPTPKAIDLVKVRLDKAGATYKSLEINQHNVIQDADGRAWLIDVGSVEMPGVEFDLGTMSKPTVAEAANALDPSLPRFAPAGDTDSSAFKRWFGESKVVDAEGKPLVVYHSGYFDEEEDGVPD